MESGAEKDRGSMAKYKKYFDKNGRLIEAWDVLKVHHFTSGTDLLSIVDETGQNDLTPINGLHRIEIDQNDVVYFNGKPLAEVMKNLRASFKVRLENLQKETGLETIYEAAEYVLLNYNAFEKDFISFCESYKHDPEYHF